MGKTKSLQAIIAKVADLYTRDVHNSRLGQKITKSTGQQILDIECKGVLFTEYGLLTRRFPLRANAHSAPVIAVRIGKHS